MVGWGFLSACGVRIPPTTFASDQFTVQERETARAVVRIHLAEGSMGSGFFISPTLILTNHHVVPANRCRTEVCPGVVAVRDFSPEGDAQVFYRLRHLAGDARLDFSLLEVLDGKAPVNGLELASVRPLSAYGYFTLLGHPLGGELMSSRGSLIQVSDRMMAFDFAAIFGNSGGPVIKVDDGKVYGILSQGSIDLSRYEIGTRDVLFTAGAVPIDSVISALEKIAPAVKSTSPASWKPQIFSENNWVLDTLLDSLLELNKPLTPNRILVSNLSDRKETDALLQKLMRDSAAGKVTSEEVDTISELLVNVGLKRGKNVELSAKTLAEIRWLKRGFDSHEKRTRLASLYMPETRPDCAKTAAYSFSPHSNIGYSCLETKFAAGGDALVTLADFVAHGKTDPMGITPYKALVFIEEQLQLRESLSADETHAVHSLVEWLDEQEWKGPFVARFSSFKLTWQRNRELLMRGGWAKSFR